MQDTIFLLLCLLLAIITVAPLSRSEAWWIRSLDFPRLQIVFLALLLLLAGFLFLERDAIFWVTAAVVAGCLAHQAWWIFPYTPLAQMESLQASQDDPDNRLRILTANVLGSNRNSRKLLEMVRTCDPDILLTLESGHWWEAQLDQLESDYPYTAKCPLDNLYGMHLYSRLPLFDCSIEYLLQDDIPSIHTAIELPSGTRVSAHFLHPRPPSPPESDRSTERDAELIVVGKKVAESDGPVIVAGDLNDVAWSRTTRLFRKVSGLLDPRVGRGMFNTFHAGHWYLRWPLDHLFHSRHFRIGKICLLSNFGSDHFPLFTELVFEGSPVNPPSKLDADADDEKQAEEKLKETAASTDDVPQPG